jgi:putative endonuclease
MDYYVYMLQSQFDGTYYKGFTTDYTRRLEEHNSGGSRYTSGKKPWKLIYVEKCQSKREALVREKSLKRSNSNNIIWLIQQPSNLIK